jgi:hypothetical protein
LFAAVVFAPAMGYSISNGERVSYSVGSEKVNYSIGGSEKVNYSIGNGTVAHEIVYTAKAPTMPIYSVSSSAMPYSFTAGGISKYTMESSTENAPVALGSQKIMTVKVLGKGLKTPAWEEQPAEPIAVPEVPVANETENVTAVVAEPTAVPEVPVANETENVTAVVAEPVVAPAPVLLGIKGMIKDENETALAGWKVDLAASDNMAIANTTSLEDGTYSFGNLTAGNYMVSVVIPDGWTAISPADGVASVSLTDMEVTQNFINQKTA